MTTILKTDVPCIKLYKNIFTVDECSELIGLLLYKSTISWNEYNTKFDQNRMITAFSWKRIKDLRYDPHPISKHMDIFSIVNTKIRDEILMELDKQRLIEFNNRIIDRWVCYLYEDGNSSSPETECIFTPGTPVIIIILGASRYLIVRSKKTGESIIKKRVREGMVLCLFEEFSKYYTYQVPKEECSCLHIQMFGSFT